MRILIAAGVTGGHIYPGIAIANEIKRLHPDAVVEFVGIQGCMEERIVPREGFGLNYIKSSGFETYSLKLKIKAFFDTFTGVVDGMKIINRFKPDVVVGMGSFITANMVWAASLKRVPSVVHEQNEYPGRAIKAVANYTDTIAVSFEDTRRYFSQKQQKKVVLTGNPVRKEFEAYTREIARKSLKIGEREKLILCLGGSLGAKSINLSVIGMARMLKEEKRVKIILISGTAQSEQIMQSAQAEQLENMTVLAYSDEMPMLLNAADVVVCRGGATTLFENIMTATPGVYIPYPHAANDHQRKNIEYITSRGGGVMLDDAQLNAESLYKAVTGIIFDEKRLKAMSENAKGAAPSDALSRLYNEIEKLL